MKKKTLLIIVIVLIIAAAGVVAWKLMPKETPAPVLEPPTTACTQEARQCPDGSYVGRTGPNCEFSPCS